MRTKRRRAPRSNDAVDVAKARTRQRAALGGDDGRGLVRWRPPTRACWTLVDSFELDGARYVVARENHVPLRGFEALTERELEAVTYLALGQSTKETAYALGITDVTVRVLLARAATKLGVRSRRELVAHEQVRAHVSRTT
jgi:DNA-binding CsgD family transcriptional regulator